MFFWAMLCGAASAACALFAFFGIIDAPAGALELGRILFFVFIAVGIISLAWGVYEKYHPPQY